MIKLRQMFQVKSFFDFIRGADYYFHLGGKFDRVVIPSREFKYQMEDTCIKILDSSILSSPHGFHSRIFLRYALKEAYK